MVYLSAHTLHCVALWCKVYSGDFSHILWNSRKIFFITSIVLFEKFFYFIFIYFLFSQAAHGVGIPKSVFHEKRQGEQCTTYCY